MSPSRTKPTHPDRVRLLKAGAPGPGPVIYWMSRDQRAEDNWALTFAQQIALERKAPLVAAFCFSHGFLDATRRHFRFMFEGLRETGERLAARQIPLVLLNGTPSEEIARTVAACRAAALVTDFDPLRIKRKWRESVARAVTIPFHEVDAHNIVPCQAVSARMEIGARTLRPKLMRALPRFLEEEPVLVRHPFACARAPRGITWNLAAALCDSMPDKGPALRTAAGARAAGRVLRRFIRERLAKYPSAAGDPTLEGQSGLSPYLHFGQISAQRVAIEVSASGAPREAVAAFLEQLVVRRELSDNYCHFNRSYDGMEGIPEWAQKTLAAHASDPRPHLYRLEDLEHGRTHDPLWNAAQRQVVATGKMHGYLRMYWAKRMLEWTESPEAAVECALTLNDRYELDGRDPSGYAGVMWSICGVHDRPWPERPLYGKIRCMTYGGCRSKFDVDGYIEAMKRL